MKFVFCDDDPKILAELKKYMKEFFKLSALPMPEMSFYGSGDALLDAQDYGDIVFLDVEMPGQSGIFVGRKIMQKKPHAKVIILTNYPEYLDEAMEFRVYRYLSKPIDKDRLFRNLKSAIKQHFEETNVIDIRTKDGLISLNSDEIICAKYSSRKTTIYTTAETLESPEGIDYWKNILTEPCFFQTHRSYIVNLIFVKKIDKLSVTLCHNGQTVTAYLTARKYTEAVNAYLQYRGGIS